MSKVYIVLFFLFSTAQLSFAQSNVNWMTIEEALAQSKIEKKKIMVDMYTDWCGWCKKMEKATFQEEHIAAYLNENYYPVKFDAEQKEAIEYKDNKYEYVKTSRRGYHELAATFTNGNLSYPTVVFLDENLNIIQAIPGFQNVKTFEMIMTFFSEDHYQNTPWQKYIKMYISPYLRDENNPGLMAQPAKGN